MTTNLDLRQLRLKDATRSLQRSVGGVEEAARITGKGKSQHGRCQSAHDGDFLTVDDAARLEAVAPRDAAWPPLTRLLAELAGGVFLPLPDAAAHDEPLALRVVRLAKELGDLAAATQDGLADGSLEAHELLRIRREGGELEVELAGLMREVDAMLAAAESPGVSALREVSRG